MSGNIASGAPEVHEEKHTRPRPPHLNDKNFSSAQADGPSNEPAYPIPHPSPSASLAGLEDHLEDMVLDTGSAFAIYPPSLETDSTLSAGPYVNQDLKKQIDSMDWLLNGSFEPSRPRELTSFSLQALDYANTIHGYHRDLANWCMSGNMFVRDRIDDRLSDSMLMPRRAKSQVTDYTTSSYDMIPDFRSPDDTADAVNGTGCLFDDIPRSPEFDSDAVMMGR